MTAGELGGGSKLALVEGGHVEMVQVFSSSAFNGVCRAGGRLDFVGSTIITQYGDAAGSENSQNTGMTKQAEPISGNFSKSP